jgi:hypothetical protein
MIIPIIIQLFFLICKLDKNINNLDFILLNQRNIYNELYENYYKFKFNVNIYFKNFTFILNKLNMYRIFELNLLYFIYILLYFLILNNHTLITYHLLVFYVLRT